MADEPLDDEDFEEDYGYPKPDDAERSNLYLVANSFDEFLSSLTTTDQG